MRQGTQREICERYAIKQDHPAQEYRMSTSIGAPYGWLTTFPLTPYL